MISVADGGCLLVRVMRGVRETYPKSLTGDRSEGNILLTELMYCSESNSVPTIEEGVGRCSYGID